MTVSSTGPIIGAAALAIAGAVALVGLPAQIEAPIAGASTITDAASPTVAGAPAPEAPAGLPPLPANMPAPGGMPFPVDIEVAFDLTDHFDNRVTEESYRGKPMMLFFGYASCESICTVALPRMGEALEHLGDDGDNVSALMITIDPERDTPKAMGTNLKRWHDRLVGLTGSEEELAAVRERFQVKREVVAEDPTGAPIYAHGSFIYFIDADGEVQTMVPPILGPERLADLARKYF